MKNTNLLNNPIIWESYRILANCAFGVCRKRFKFLLDHGLLNSDLSIIDIGCGIGCYSSVTRGKYFGVDLEGRYIDYARKRNCFPNCSFQSADAASISPEGQGFDIALMVDFLHHIPDDQCLNILNNVKRIARRHIIIFDPVAIDTRGLLGRFLAMGERGEYVRSVDRLYGLLEQCKLKITHSVHLSFGPVDSVAIIIDLPQSP